MALPEYSKAIEGRCRAGNASACGAVAGYHEIIIGLSETGRLMGEVDGGAGDRT